MDHMHLARFSPQATITGTSHSGRLEKICCERHQEWETLWFSRDVREQLPWSHEPGRGPLRSGMQWIHLNGKLYRRNL